MLVLGFILACDAAFVTDTSANGLLVILFLLKFLLTIRINYYVLPNCELFCGFCRLLGMPALRVVRRIFGL